MSSFFLTCGYISVPYMSMVPMEVKRGYCPIPWNWIYGCLQAIVQVLGKAPCHL